MKDFKHLTQHRRPASPNVRRRPEPSLAFPAPVHKEHGRTRFRLLLPVVGLLLVGYPLLSLFLPTRQASSSVSTGTTTTSKAPLGSYASMDCGQALRLGLSSLGSCRDIDGVLQAPLPGGATGVYSLNLELQGAVEQMLADYQVPYGVFVAIEPKTGKILAMTGYSSVDPAWPARSYFGLFPMASLFKIVTASAALERQQVSAETPFQFRGRLTSENPRYWEIGPRSRNAEMTLAQAMGKSVNPVFGRLASDVVGTEAIMGMSDRFGFNSPLFPGSPLTVSQARQPADRHELMRMGAGLGREVKVSPLHAAAIMAGIANDGVMMAPSLLTEIRGEGGPFYRQAPTPVRQLVSGQTAGELDRMLVTTVSSGTSRRAFHDRRGRLKLADVEIAAKTGSIDGDDPAGHYSWFAAYAPVNDPQIALVALVINQDRWRIKGTHVGERALEVFFR
jgi:cell division protein FtsI/penicillin-binding protein 2